MKTKPSTLLKVMGIISIVGAALTIIGAVSMMALGGVIGANFDTFASDPAFSGSVTIDGQTQALDGTTAASVGMLGGLIGGIVMLIIGIFWLILGIAAVTGKCGLAKGLSYFLIVLYVLSLISGIYLMVSGQGDASMLLSPIVGAIFPILVLVGVKQTQQKAAPLQDLRSAN